MFIVGITGKAGSGKDHLAKRLMETAQGSCAVLKFADDIHDDLTRLQIHGYEKPYSREQRELMQALGKYRRSQDEDWYIKSLVNTLPFVADFDYVFITDVRFDNEADFIHDQGGILFETMAFNNVRGERLGVPHNYLAIQNEDPTERGVSEHKVDFFLASNEEYTNERLKTIWNLIEKRRSVPGAVTQ